MTKADDKEVEFRKQVVLMVTRVNTARTLKGKNGKDKKKTVC